MVCIMVWPCSSVRPSVRPSTIACERDILKTACGIDFTFRCDLNLYHLDLGRY